MLARGLEAGQRGTITASQYSGQNNKAIAR